MMPAATTSSQLSFFIRSVLLAIGLLAVSTSLALPIQSNLSARGNSLSAPIHHCPSISDIETNIRRKSRGTISDAVYYSWPGSMRDAQEFAKKIKGHTIFDFVANEDIATWGKFCSDEEKRDLWAHASHAFANLSSGTVYVVTNGKVKGESVWKTHELPALKASGLVHTLIYMDPENNFHKSILNKHQMHVA